MDGVFEVYTKSVQIKVGNNVYTYTLRPLSGKYLPKLYKLISSLPENDEDGQIKFKASEVLNEENIAISHELLLETFKKSYPKEDVTKLEEFVTQNLIHLLPALFEVNIKTEQKE